MTYTVANPDERSYALYVATADGTNTIKVADSHDPVGRVGWSPDGSRMTYTVFDSVTGDWALYVANADGTSTTKVADSNGWVEWSPK